MTQNRPPVPLILDFAAMIERLRPLTAEERGVLMSLHEFIYDCQGPVPHAGDPEWLNQLCGETETPIGEIIAKFERLGHVEIIDGRLFLTWCKNDIAEMERRRIREVANTGQGGAA